MSEAATSAVTLRALHGEPLEDDRVRETVLATARAIAERQGVEIVELRADPASVTVTVRGPRVVALGLAAELRRLTTRWYTAKFGEPTLWGEGPDAAAEAWKQR